MKFREKWDDQLNSFYRTNDSKYLKRLIKDLNENLIKSSDNNEEYEEIGNYITKTLYQIALDFSSQNKVENLKEISKSAEEIYDITNCSKDFWISIISLIDVTFFNESFRRISGMTRNNKLNDFR